MAEDERTVGYAVEPETPLLEARAYALVARLVAPADPETARPTGRRRLFAAWAVPGEPTMRYGTRVTSAIRVVAVDVATGRVHERPADNGQLPPIRLGPILPEGVGPRGSAGQFDLDLEQHLGLPPERRTYAVFLWLDGMTSALQLVETAPGPREPGPAFARFPGVASPETLVPDDLELRAARDATGHVRVEGFGFAPGRAPAEPVAVTVLALCAETRRLAWRAAHLPDPRASEWGLSFDLDALLPEAPETRTRHVLLTAGHGLSEPLAVARGAP